MNWSLALKNSVYLVLKLKITLHLFKCRSDDGLVKSFQRTISKMWSKPVHWTKQIWTYILSLLKTFSIVKSKDKSFSRNLRRSWNWILLPVNWIQSQNNMQISFVYLNFSFFVINLSLNCCCLKKIYGDK